MNKIILMIGGIIFVYILMLAIFPSFESFKRRKIHMELSKDAYNICANIFSILISIMINFLTWGWFL